MAKCMLNIHWNEWSQIFAQASFSYIIDDVLHKDLPVPLLLKVIEEKIIHCFSISVNAKVQDILGNYSLLQIMEIFDQSFQFKDCFWINAKPPEYYAF